MPSEAEIYSQHADQYDRLISCEDYRHNISRTLNEILAFDGLDVLDLGAGTGRLSAMLAGKARSLLSTDAAPGMLKICRDKLLSVNPGRAWAVAADHRSLPLSSAIADVIVSGWSVSYLSTWDTSAGEQNLSDWIVEAGRVLRPNSHIILLESLGTGNEKPDRLGHLLPFYEWLDKNLFKSTWIRTDYKFGSLDEADELVGFFFGRELAERIRKQNLLILPECTGIWWKQLGQ